MGKRILGAPINSASFTYKLDENSFLAIKIFPYKSSEAFSSCLSCF